MSDQGYRRQASVLAVLCLREYCLASLKLDLAQRSRCISVSKVTALIRGLCYSYITYSVLLHEGGDGPKS